MKLLITKEIITKIDKLCISQKMPQNESTLNTIQVLCEKTSLDHYKNHMLRLD